jgi:hypothetical protein
VTLAAELLAAAYAVQIALPKGPVRTSNIAAMPVSCDKDAYNVNKSGRAALKRQPQRENRHDHQ